MNIPKTIEDLKKIIEMKVPESLHLDYKASPAFSPEKKDEICKDVSAFANSDGGMLIYGIKEEKVNKIGYPASIDDGVDTSKFGKEWIDQILTSNIRPVLSGVEIAEIKISENRSVMVIHAPKSFRGPHQAPDKKYYKRRNVVSEPMEHYEIEDVRSRRRKLSPLVNLDVKLKGRCLYFVVENIGDEVAHNVKFIFPDNFSWHKGEMPNVLKNGIKFLPPSRRIPFFTGVFHEIINSNFEKEFDILIRYQHPAIDSETIESIHVNLDDFSDSSVENDPLVDISLNVKQLAKAVDELQKLNTHIQYLKNISGATGLDLSVTTLRNISKVLQGNTDFQPLNIKSCYSYSAIEEMLEVDQETAAKVYHHLCRTQPRTSVEEIPGMTEELLEKIRKRIK
ncbi:helix-turn-helix domain-containing protein [Candidatus Electronema sp. JC]|uniref:AlbA family DNA-binding domain-containing protein n=1 Tax=Candidatus Electronema sp. JC TaxID=3401570 RepID=UPI003B43ADEE